MPHTACRRSEGRQSHRLRRVDAKDTRAAAPIARDFVIESIQAAGGTPIGIYVFDGEDDRPLRAPEKLSGEAPQRFHERKVSIA